MCSINVELYVYIKPPYSVNINYITPFVQFPMLLEYPRNNYAYPDARHKARIVWHLQRGWWQSAFLEPLSIHCPHACRILHRYKTFTLKYTLIVIHLYYCWSYNSACRMTGQNSNMWNKSMNEWMNEWMKERKKERMNEWMNKSINVFSFSAARWRKKLPRNCWFRLMRGTCVISRNRGTSVLFRGGEGG